MAALQITSKQQLSSSSACPLWFSDTSSAAGNCRPRIEVTHRWTPCSALRVATGRDSAAPGVTTRSPLSNQSSSTACIVRFVKALSSGSETGDPGCSFSWLRATCCSAASSTRNCAFSAYQPACRAGLSRTQIVLDWVRSRVLRRRARFTRRAARPDVSQNPDNLQVLACWYLPFWRRVQLPALVRAILPLTGYGVACLCLSPVAPAVLTPGVGCCK